MAYVGGDIRYILHAAQVVLAREMFHARITAPFVAKADELPSQHLKMLPGNHGHGAIACAGALAAMACGAGIEQLLAMRNVRFQPGYGGEFLLCRGARVSRDRPPKKNR